MPYTVITLGGVAFGVCILVAIGMHWWLKEKGGKRAVLSLLPVLLSWCYGMLAVLSAVGAWSLAGGAAWMGLWAAQVLGYAALVYGVGGNSPDVTRSGTLVITDGGYVILLIATVVIICLWLWGRVPRWKLLAGFVSGSSLALAGSVAGACAIPLASAVNALGAGFTSALT